MSAICKPGDPGYIKPGSIQACSHIGCSEVGSILGMGFETPDEVYRRKTFRAARDGEKRIFERGHDMEPVMVKRLQQDYNRRVVAEQVQYTDPANPWFIYHADGMFPMWSPLQDGDKTLEGPGIWEGKAPGSRVAADMRANGMSQHYVCQGQSGMYVASQALGRPINWGTFGFLDYDEYSLVAFDVPYRQEFMDGALPILKAFYRCLANDCPPDPCEPGELIAELPTVKGDTVTISSGDLWTSFCVLKELRDAREAAEAAYDSKKAELMVACGDMTSVVLSSVGRISYSWHKGRETIDGRGLLTYCQHLVEAYNDLVAGNATSLTPKTFRREDWVKTGQPSRTFTPTFGGK
jgi:hypothetical protein